MRTRSGLAVGTRRFSTTTTAAKRCGTSTLPVSTTVEQLESALRRLRAVTAQHMIKTIIFTANPDTDGQFEVAVCIRGDLEINAVKVRNALGVDEVVPAAASVVVEATSAEVGFAGPLGLLERGHVHQILFDRSTQGMTNFLCGCNQSRLPPPRRQLRA